MPEKPSRSRRLTIAQAHQFSTSKRGQRVHEQAGQADDSASSIATTISVFLTLWDPGHMFIADALDTVGTETIFNNVVIAAPSPATILLAGNNCFM
jgi:hypothetical protein